MTKDSTLLKTCEPEVFIDDGWILRDASTDTRTLLDGIQSPAFEVHDFLMVRIESNTGIIEDGFYFNGDFHALMNTGEAIQRHYNRTAMRDTSLMSKGSFLHLWMTCINPSELLDASIGYIHDRMRLQILVDLLSDLPFLGKVNIDDPSAYGDPFVIPRSLEESIRNCLGGTMRRKVGTCGTELMLSRIYRELTERRSGYDIDVDYCKKIRKAIPFRKMLEGLSR